MSVLLTSPGNLCEWKCSLLRAGAPSRSLPATKLLSEAALPIYTHVRSYSSYTSSPTWFSQTFPFSPVWQEWDRHLIIGFRFLIIWRKSFLMLHIPGGRRAEDTQVWFFYQTSYTPTSGGWWFLLLCILLPSWGKKSHTYVVVNLVCTKWDLFAMYNPLIAGHLAFTACAMPV